jgi:hypothetical protein
MLYSLVIGGPEAIDIYIFLYQLYGFIGLIIY